MREKIIFSVAILTLLSLAVFVSAWAGEINFDFDEGWNLVYGLGGINQLEGQTLEKSSIKAIYAFIPIIQKYARAYPNPELEKINLIDDDELMNTAFWVYTEKGALSEYWLAEEVVPLKDRPMYAGWNFVGITFDMVGHKLEDLKGSCNIEKSYFWVNEFQEWRELPLASTPAIEDEAIGFGWVIKVSNNCNLGQINTGIAPPELPVDGKDMICGDNICYGKSVKLGIGDSTNFLNKKITLLERYEEKPSPYFIKLGVKLKVGDTEGVIEFDKMKTIEGIPIHLLGGGGTEKYSLNLGESAWTCLEDCKNLNGYEIIECEEYTGRTSTCVDFPHACKNYFKNYTIEEMPEGKLCVSKGQVNMFGTACCIPN